MASAALATIAAVSSFRSNDCGNCGPNAAGVALPGFTLYLFLLVGHEVRLAWRVFVGTAWFLLGGHAVLAGLMYLTSSYCVVCMALAGLSVIVALSGKTIGRAGWHVCAWSMLMGLVATYLWIQWLS